MHLDEGKIAFSAAVCAALGIALLFAFSETAQSATAASALVSQENSLLLVSGTARNVTSDKFLLCDVVCISIRKQGTVPGELVREGGEVKVLGRVHEYRGNRYLEAEKIEVE
jgi:DNA/RNA endonuclease YhcR with UshA esterase domain